MAKRKTHPQVEFVVEIPDRLEAFAGMEKTFRSFDEAAGFAVTLALMDGESHNVDVLVYSESGARWYGGDDAVGSYREDPEASVFERISIKAHSHGRIA